MFNTTFEVSGVNLVISQKKHWTTQNCLVFNFANTSENDILPTGHIVRLKAQGARTSNFEVFFEREFWLVLTKDALSASILHVT